MDKFTADEMNLMCIYDTGTREGLMEQLKSQPRTEHKKTAPKKSAEREL